VREGSWWRGETDSQYCELEGVASLQQLAASVMGDGEEEGEAAEGGDSPAAAAAEGEAGDAGEQQQEGGEQPAQVGARVAVFARPSG
jgi:hypothetical protein